MVKDFLAAQRYAKALFEIARELHRDEEIEAELESLSAALKSDGRLEKFLTNPALRIDEKKAVLLRLYQERNQEIYEHLMNFFLILFEKNRFFLVHEIAVQFKRIADEAQGQGVAEVRSATPLKIEAEKAIVSRLEKMAGYKITVHSVVDPSLIGGVMVKVRNKVIDDTVKNKIHLFKKELTKLGSI